MKVKVNAIHFSADKKLIDFINERVGKLETFYDKIISSEATLRIEESSGKEPISKDFVFVALSIVSIRHHHDSLR